MTKVIYLIVGETGQYDGYRQWNVKACGEWGFAQGICDYLNHVAAENTPNLEAVESGKRPPYFMPEDRDKLRVILSAYDPQVLVDYTGVNYKVVEVPWEEEPETDT